MPAELLVVRFDDEAFEDDVRRYRLGAPAREVAERARESFSSEGVPRAQLEPCAIEGRDGTQLAGRVKLYLPLDAAERPFRMHFTPGVIGDQLIHLKWPRRPHARPLSQTEADYLRSPPVLSVYIDALKDQNGHTSRRGEVPKRLRDKSIPVYVWDGARFGTWVEKVALEGDDDPSAGHEAGHRSNHQQHGDGP